MTESDLLREVLALAGKHGVLAFHSGDSRRDQGDNGFPDLVLCGSAGVLFAELKDDSRSRSQAQTIWRYRLQSAGQHAPLWRPGDLANGTIEPAIRWLHQMYKMPNGLRETIYSR
jgi:hypothetical protein